MSLTVAGRRDIVVDQGADWGPLVVAYQADGATDSVMSAPNAEVRAVDGGALVATFAAALQAGGTEIALTIDEVSTALMAPGRHLWDLFATEAGGDRVRLLYGEVTVRKAVTGG